MLSPKGLNSKSIPSGLGIEFPGGNGIFCPTSSDRLKPVTGTFPILLEGRAVMCNYTEWKRD